MAIPVTTRSGKGSPLTQAEMDTNLTELARSATELEEGNIEIADQAEVDALSDATKAIPPAYLQQTVETLIDSFPEVSLATNGYYDLPGGLTFQWGVKTITATTTVVTFPKAFTEIFTVIALQTKSGDTGGAELSVVLKEAPTSTKATFSTRAADDNVHWIAIGRT